MKQFGQANFENNDPHSDNNEHPWVLDPGEYRASLDPGPRTGSLLDLDPRSESLGPGSRTVASLKKKRFGAAAMLESICLSKSL